MRVLRAFFCRVASLFKRSAMDREMQEELEAHLQMEIDENLRAGMTPGQARRAALLKSGGLEAAKEAYRDRRGLPWLETALADFRYAARTLRRSPLFAIAAAGTLALGIGANTAIFSVLNAAFLRPLPYDQPERLVWATESLPVAVGVTSQSRVTRDLMFVPEYAAWREQATAFEHLEAFGTPIGRNLAGAGRSAERVQVGHVTPGFFTMLGAVPQLGRTFAAGEDEPGRDRVALLSDSLWRNSFESDPAVVGTQIALDGNDYTVIGVMASDFIDPAAADTAVWLPDAVDSEAAVPARAMNLLGGVIGRLGPEETVETAGADLEAITRRMDDQYPTPWSGYHADAHVRVVPLQEQFAANSTMLLSILMGAAGLILLIVCANVANMFLSRTVSRQKEIALRAAIGASRSRLVRLLLAEGLLLGLVGGLAGLALMHSTTSSLRFLLPSALPQHIPIDLRVLGFAALCSIGASVLFGLAPALGRSNPDLNTSLKEGVADRRRRFGFRDGLAIAQIAMSLVLLIGAGLLARSFIALINVDPGFNPRNVLVADIALAPAEIYGPDRKAEFYRRALEEIRTLPGIEYASITDQGPLVTFQAIASGLAAEGQASSDASVIPTSVSTDYFLALEIPLVAGRFFDDHDRAGALRVGIINKTLAGILFPNADPIGRRIRFGHGEDPWVTVVGVVGDIRHRSLDDEVWPKLYQPYGQAPKLWMSFIVKTAIEPSVLVPEVRQVVAGIDPDQPLFFVGSMEDRLSSTLAQRRQRALLLGAFALLALVIAAVGVYGVVACSVARRTREVGIRMALGAQPSTILAMVIMQGMRMTLAGVILGVAGALGLSRVLSSFLFGVTATDTATFFSVCLLMVTAACLATYIPARRATRVAPMVALRQD